MGIKEAEEATGISRQNIRFYEEQGLLTPRRNSENGYREYGETEIETLRRIKLMRKLGVPIPEIRQMLSGSHTVGDGMRRHLRGAGKRFYRYHRYSCDHIQHCRLYRGTVLYPV